MNRDFEPLRDLNRRPFIRWDALQWRQRYRRNWRRPAYWVLYVEHEGQPSPVLLLTEQERKELRAISPRNVAYTRLRDDLIFMRRELPWLSSPNYATMPSWLRDWRKRWSHIGHKFPDWS